MMQLRSMIVSIAVLLAVAFNANSQDIESLKSPLTAEEQQRWRATLEAYDYVGVARAYADFMLEHGRDVYGQPSPMFVTGIDRHSGKMISLPFPHVKRKPFMPGFERDRECRGSDRNYGQADPLDQMDLLQLMHRLTEVTREPQYSQEAKRTTAWWMSNCQTGIGLYPWGTHTSWNVSKESGGGLFEFNHVWPYWKQNPEALQRYARALWDHYVKDKTTGDFNRHANSNSHGPGSGMEFPWPGSAMIAVWVEAYLANPDPEYVRAIETILKRWESLRDENGHLAPCSNYKEWAWYGGGYTVAANRLDDCALRIEKKEPELAEKMRDYGRRCDAAYFKLADNLLDVKRVGLVKSYLRETGGYNPERLDILGGPWQDRKNYAQLAVLLYERARRTESPQIRDRFNRAVLDSAELYMSINPEVQWSVWGANMSYAIELMFAAYDLTGNAAYLHRADHFARLCIDLFLDQSCPLPKITSHDDFYEIERVTGKATDAWMLSILELHKRLAKLDEQHKETTRITTSKTAKTPNQGGVWDCTTLSRPTASVSLSYGTNGEKSLLLSRRQEGFSPSKGLLVDGLELIVSDFINHIPTLEEAAPLNGPYRRRFSGKHQEVCTASYGGFKDVLDSVNLLLANCGDTVVCVTVTATFHDSWDDRETKDYVLALPPGAQANVACSAASKRFIRRLDFKCNRGDAVRLKQFAFVMTQRSKMNPQAANVPLFNDVKPKLVTEGLVLQLSTDAFQSLADGPAVSSWKSQPALPLVASADGDHRPTLASEGGRRVLRFDGKDDFMTIADNDALDLSAWTMIVVARPRQGPGVIMGKVDSSTHMMNYRMQVEHDGSIGALVRGQSAHHQVNRLARARTLGRFSVVAARFDPAKDGTKKIDVHLNGIVASQYSYENAEGELTKFTHDEPLEIGRQPGREPRYFGGDIADILLYNRSLNDEELGSTGRWLFDRMPRATVREGKTK